jgi:hypothetical protein
LISPLKDPSGNNVYVIIIASRAVIPPTVFGTTPIVKTFPLELMNQPPATPEPTAPILPKTVAPEGATFAANEGNGSSMGSVPPMVFPFTTPQVGPEASRGPLQVPATPQVPTAVVKDENAITTSEYNALSEY